MHSILPGWVLTLLPHPPRRFTSFALIALVLAVGCGGDDEEGDQGTARKGTFVGKVDGTDAYIAIVSNGSAVTGYLCDGKTVSSWFARTSLKDSKARLVARVGQALGNVTIDSDEASGEVEVGGERRTFAAVPAEGEAGLYRSSQISADELPEALERGAGTLPAGSYERGWIVLADGSFRGARKRLDNILAVGNPEGQQAGEAFVAQNPRAPVGPANQTTTQLQVTPDPAPQCQDFVDNDGDGRQDRFDPGCEGTRDNSESPDPRGGGPGLAQCADRRDNDGDGRPDEADPGCESTTDQSESPDPR